MKKFIIILLTVYLNTSFIQAKSDSIYEYNVKAVFMYQFVDFIDGWKFENEDVNDTEPFIIGIIGDNPFGEAFGPLKDRLVKNKKVSIKYFKGFSELKKYNETLEIHPDIEGIQRCHVIFVSNSEKLYLSNILNSIRGKNILTIGDLPDFLKQGGIINFIIEKNKVRFSINLVSAKRANLKIRAKLLRLAKDVIE